MTQYLGTSKKIGAIAFAIALLSAACGDSGGSAVSTESSSAESSEQSSSAASVETDSGSEDAGDDGASESMEDVPGVTVDEVTIGISLPTSGPAGPVCRPLEEAAHAWFEQTNSEGGIHGRMIEEVVRDDQYQAPMALANAREFSEMPVFAIFGGCGSPQPPAIQTVAQPEGIPYLFPGGSLPELEGDSNVFLAWPSYDRQMGTLTTYALEEYGEGSVYIVSQQIPGLDSFVGASKDAAAAAGQEVVGESVITVGEPDLGPTILKIRDAQPDYLVMNVSTDAARMIEGLIAQDALPTKKILGWAPILTAAVIEGSTSLPDGMVVAASVTAAPDSPEMSACAEVMNASTPGLTDDANANFACAAAQAFTYLLEAVGPDLTRGALEEELLSWDEVTASPALPPLTFTDEDRSGVSGIFVVELSGGTVHQIDQISFS